MFLENEAKMGEVTLESQLIEIIKDEEMAEHIKQAKIDMLIKLGVEVNAMYGAKSALKLTKDNNLKKVAELLENNGAKDVFDEEIAKELGVKLIELCTNGEKKDVEELIDMGADINQKDSNGQNALGHALIWEHKEIVKLLISRGADVNAKNELGNTALIRASKRGYEEIVELLIQKGADVHQKDNDGQNAMMVAYDNGTKKSIMDAVKKRNIKENGTIIGSIKNLFER